jgi:hypothetical protein
MPERFGELYGIKRKADEEWFDPLLTEDTHLYVDPFLIFTTSQARWMGGHERLMSYFQMVLELLSSSGFKNTSPAFKKAEGLLLFHEPPEFCLGTSEESVLGAGSGAILKEGMLRGAALAIKGGIENLKHFEEIALFGDQIGPDRIGDMTCDILKSDFIIYTQEICKRHGVPTTSVSVKNADWSKEFKRWLPGNVPLPVNPYASAKAGHPVGVILTPKEFLRRLPTVEPMEFWEFAMSADGEQIRADLNYEIGQRVDRKMIVKLASTRRNLLRDYLEKLEEHPKDPYDVDVDPDYIVKEYDEAKFVASALAAVPPPMTAESLAHFVEKLVENYKQCVEVSIGGTLLWADGRHRNEKAAQALFWTSARLACKLKDIDLTPEAETGRGPVDFKLSQGASKKVLIEIKLGSSSSFWRNEEFQMATYLRAEGCDLGFLVVVQFTDSDCSEGFVERAKKLAADVAKEKKLDFRAVFVDARKKKSASKVGPKDE